MTYKFIGAFLILISAILWAAATVQAEKKRLAVLRLFVRLVQDIRSRIEHFNLPISEILAQSESELVKNFLAVRPSSDLSFERLLEKEGTGLCEKEKALLEEFSRALGRSYREEEIKTSRFFSEKLEKICTEKEKELEGRRKMTFTLSICFALAVIILMI